MSRQAIDLYAHVLPSGPSEWAPVPDEVLERIQPDHLGLITPSQWELEKDAVAGSRWFILENSFGWRCSSCRQGSLPGTIHPNVTYGCIDRPFNGVDECRAYIHKMSRTPEMAEKIIQALLLGEKMKSISARDARALERRILDKTGVDLAKRRRIRREYQRLRDKARRALAQRRITQKQYDATVRELDRRKHLALQRV